MMSTQHDKTWDLNDELKLFNALRSCGFGSWREISSRIGHYSPEECKQHFLEKFLTPFDGDMRKAYPDILPEDNSDCSFNSSDISKMNELLKSLENNDLQNSNNKNCQEFSSNSGLKSCHNKLQNHMIALPAIGYNRIRSDFEIEYDNKAEHILTAIQYNHLSQPVTESDGSRLFDEIEYVLIQSYNDRLKERFSRRKIIRNHCLIDRRKTFTMLQRLDVSFGRTTLKALIPVMRFLSGPKFDFLIEKLKYQNELRSKMNSYIKYRKNGLKYLNDIDTFKKLDNKRFKYNTELSSMKFSFNVEMKGSCFQASRKPVTPLALEHLPGYNLLNDDEIQLCSTSRIVPETFISFKEVLVSECKKHNGLRLAQARQLIKIDVNKTRKIYDYLKSINAIWTPET